MKLFPKLALLVLCVAIIPLSVVGFSLIRVQRGEMSSLLEDKQEALASAAAERIGRELHEVVSRVVNVVRLVDLDTLGEEEKLGLLRAVYRQSDDVQSVTWGTLRVAPNVDAANVRALDAMIPQLLKLASKDDDAVTTDAVFFLGSKTPSIFVVVAPAIVVQVKLAAAERAFALLPEGVAGVLVGRDGKLLVRPEQVSLADPISVPEKSAFRFNDAAGARASGAVAAVPETAMKVLVIESEAQAFWLARHMQNITLLGLVASALLSLAVGFVASRGLRQRLGHYDSVARGLGGGTLSLRVNVDSEDELGVLGRTMNAMAAEIEAWNRELQSRVEQRTAELVSAQKRLVQAARLAAVGQLGAGVAHEIGNPLARIIGHTQLLQIDTGLGADALDSIAKIESAARRVDSITKALLRFSETQQLPAEEGLPLAPCVEEAVGLVREQIESKGITLAMDVDGAIRIKGQRSQLISALFQLLDNAKNASGNGASIIAYAKKTEQGTLLGVRDTGSGISPEHKDKLFDPFFTTKQNWDSPGLGLSLVYRIAEAHGATMRVDSELGRGTDIAMVFP